MIDSVNGGQSSAPPAAGQGPGAVWQQVLQSAGSVLGMSTSDLATALKSGQSLSEIAQQKGVSQSDLTGAVTQALNTAAQNGAQLPTDASSMAQQIVNQKGGPSGPPSSPPSSWWQRDRRGLFEQRLVGRQHADLDLERTRHAADRSAAVAGQRHQLAVPRPAERRQRAVPRGHRRRRAGSGSGGGHDGVSTSSGAVVTPRPGRAASDLPGSDLVVGCRRWRTDGSVCDRRAAGAGPCPPAARHAATRPPRPAGAGCGDHRHPRRDASARLTAWCPVRSGSSQCARMARRPDLRLQRRAARFPHGLADRDVRLGLPVEPGRGDAARPRHRGRDRHGRRVSRAGSPRAFRWSGPRDHVGERRAVPARDAQRARSAARGDGGARGSRRDPDRGARDRRAAGGADCGRAVRSWSRRWARRSACRRSTSPASCPTAAGSSRSRSTPSGTSMRSRTSSAPVSPTAAICACRALPRAWRRSNWVRSTWCSSTG